MGTHKIKRWPLPPESQPHEFSSYNMIAHFGFSKKSSKVLSFCGNKGKVERKEKSQKIKIKSNQILHGIERYLIQSEDRPEWLVN
jgi:hypothetical protein